MIVGGHEIDQEHIRRITAWMRAQQQPFARDEVFRMLYRGGTPWGKCDRAVDRLLQWERRHGYLKHVGRGLWASTELGRGSTLSPPQGLSD